MAKKKSLQTPMNRMMEPTNSTGDSSGRMIRTNTCIELAPSIAAAFSRSTGMLRMKPVARKTRIPIRVPMSTRM